MPLAQVAAVGVPPSVGLALFFFLSLLFSPVAAATGAAAILPLLLEMNVVNRIFEGRKDTTRLEYFLFTVKKNIYLS